MFDNEEERQAIRELVATIYRSISGPAGAPRAWTEFEACFLPDARLGPFRVDGDGNVTFDIITPQSYIATRTPIFATTPFFENETGHAASIEGRIAHVFSHYEARHAPDEPPFATGVNSIQLVRTAESWRVLSMTWRFTGAGSRTPADTR